MWSIHIVESYSEENEDTHNNMDETYKYNIKRKKTSYKNNAI